MKTKGGKAMKKQVDSEVVRQNREALLKAFADLRKQGLIALANFSCCQNCAGSEIATRIDDMDAKHAAKVKGCVYWHNQDEDDLRERGHVALAYGSLGTRKHGEVGLPTVEVGKMVVEALKERGLCFAWNGSDGQRILVDLNVVNEKASIPKVEVEEQKAKKLLKMKGWDGNVFSVMGHTQQALRDAGIEKAKISAVIEECTKGSYDHALATCVAALKEAGYEIR